MKIRILGVPLDLGQERRGVDMGPSAVRHSRYPAGEMKVVAALGTILLWSAMLTGQSKTGTLCVAPVPSELEPGLFTPGGEYNPRTLALRIDKNKPVAWPHKGKLKIADLDLVKRHSLVVISDGKPIQSMWFRFSEYRTSDLCLSYDAYTLIQLADKNGAHWCTCK